MPTFTEFLYGGERRVPRGPLQSMSPLETWGKRTDTGLRATWLGHSTVLIEIDGLRVLTDPVWGPRASPSRFAGPKRFQPVPVPLRALPPVDVVIVSHDHYDHLDYPTIRELAKRDVPFVTSLGVGAHLEAWGVRPERIVELDWWESHRLPNAGLTVTAAPSQHFSGRGMKDRNSTLWSSMVIRTERHAVFFGGDGGLTNEYQVVRERLGPFDLVMLEVGAFHPAWGDIHLGPANALKALAMLGGGAFLPVHWGTFCLAMHAWDQPAEELLELAPKSRCASGDAAARRSGGTGARGKRYAVVAQRREAGRQEGAGAGADCADRYGTAESDALADRLSRDRVADLPVRRRKSRRASSRRRGEGSRPRKFSGCRHADRQLP